jgi:hypothetical protein
MHFIMCIHQGTKLNQSFFFTFNKGTSADGIEKSIRIPKGYQKPKMDGKYNGQKTTDKRTNKDLQNTTPQKSKVE